MKNILTILSTFFINSAALAEFPKCLEGVANQIPPKCIEKTKSFVRNAAILNRYKTIISSDVVINVFPTMINGKNAILSLAAISPTTSMINIFYAEVAPANLLWNEDCYLTHKYTSNLDVTDPNEEHKFLSEMFNCKDLK